MWQFPQNANFQSISKVAIATAIIDFNIWKYLFIFYPYFSIYA